MKTLKEILHELKEIKKTLQAIASSSECQESVELPLVDMNPKYIEIKFNKER